MITLKGTYRNGIITLDESLPKDLEGKKVEVLIQESSPQKRRKRGANPRRFPPQGNARRCGSAKGQIWMSSDFDEPLELN